MLIGILGDTHDQRERTRRAVGMLRDGGAEALFHCGDLTGPEIVEELAPLPCWFVFGNNDCDAVPDLRRAAVAQGVNCLEWGGQIALAGKRIALVHGHLNSDLRPLLRDQPDYLFSGHSHAVNDRWEGVTRRINPGALHRADSYTVALLDLVTEELRFLTVPR